MSDGRWGPCPPDSSALDGGSSMAGGCLTLLGLRWQLGLAGLRARRGRARGGAEAEGGAGRRGGGTGGQTGAAEDDHSAVRAGRLGAASGARDGVLGWLAMPTASA